MSIMHLPGVRTMNSTNQMHLQGSKTERSSDDVGREQLEIWQLKEENKKLREQCKHLEYEQAASLSEISVLREQVDHFNLRWEAREALIDSLQQTILCLQSRIDESFRFEVQDAKSVSPCSSKHSDAGLER